MISFVEIVFISIFLIPLYIFLIWSYIEPEESILSGKKWMYKDEPEPSLKAIRYTRFTSLTAMIGIPFILSSFITGNLFLRFMPLIFIFVFVFGALKICISVDDS
ncbi:hypothetical protein [Ureibacillus aquaedulcis]|uniref:DUF3784 domain-containing protein n=1 Tax=Ureibacillus aquaedulcis TaxID=3058421 RepID=A0ABT8GST4_9BACL|nr:hypothetical protein [Ureibacillus sp. BA0131]MDN4494480.1 hypothetical protein [Ureibacillus sp. BA0131]